MTVTIQEFSQKFQQEISNASHILVMSHKNHDGDSVGSVLAMYSALKSQGKKVDAYIEGTLPEQFVFMEYADEVISSFDTMDVNIHFAQTDLEIEKIDYSIEKTTFNVNIHPKSGKLHLDQMSIEYGDLSYDLVIFLDLPDLELASSAMSEYRTFFERVTKINIDHHTSNTNFGDLNYIESTFPSTGEVLYSLFRQLKYKITPKMATSLLACIVADTGSFQQISTTSQSFYISSVLMDLGGDHQLVVENLLRRKPLSQLSLWGKVLSNMDIDKEHGIVWTFVSQKDFEETGASEMEAQDTLGKLIVGIPHTHVAVIIYEIKKGTIRVSFRVSGRYDAVKMSRKFSGRGHKLAAHFSLHDIPLKEAISLVIDAFRNEVLEVEREMMKKKAMSPDQIIEHIGELMENSEQEKEESSHEIPSENVLKNRILGRGI